MQGKRRLGWLVAVVGLLGVGGYASLPAQQTAKTPAAPVFNGRFEFEIVESFDAKYSGDTPGHIGRHGGLGDFRPQAALGDPVFRGDEKIGTVSTIIWSRGQGSLEVEFDPEPKVRISVGDVVWLKLGNK